MINSSTSEGTNRSDARPKAIVVGAGGQDGTLLASQLRKRGYEVFPLTRLGVLRADGAIEPLDLLDGAQVAAFVKSVCPNEIYFLAAHHHSSDEDVGDLARLLKQSYETHCQSFLTLLEACVKYSAQTRVFYASSALVFGYPDRAPADELKRDAFRLRLWRYKIVWNGIVRDFRRDYGLFCCAGILFE